MSSWYRDTSLLDRDIASNTTQHFFKYAVIASISLCNSDWGDIFFLYLFIQTNKFVCSICPMLSLTLSLSPIASNK